MLWGRISLSWSEFAESLWSRVPPLAGDISSALCRSPLRFRTSLENFGAPGSGRVRTDRRLLKDGNVEIQVWLEDASVEVRQALKALGFELVGEPRVAKILLGRIPAEKLGERAEITSVRYVGPLGR